jgi:stage IV sporulation protein FB
MLRFDVMGISVGVHWMFWLISAMLGGGLRAEDAQDWGNVAIWTAVVFVSILVHELGHALIARRFGAPSEIILHGFGGVTIMPANYLNRRQSIFVSAAGPAAGLCLGLTILLAVFTVPRIFGPVASEGLQIAAIYALYVNFFWTFINLLPIQPMDGGQILRDVLGPSRFKITCVIGMFCAIAVGLLALKAGMMILGFFMFYFAYLNYMGQANDGGVITR